VKDMRQIERMEILENNVAELQEQLQNSYKRIAELTENNRAVEQERDTLIHQQFSEEEGIKKEIKNKKDLTSFIENAMNHNIKTFQTILGKLKGV
jgi:uncharacterized protein